MRLELGKTYRCRNGAEVKMERAERTMTGAIDRVFGNAGMSTPIAYYPNGEPVDRRMAGYGIVAEVGAEPELMFSFRVFSPEHSKTVSESELKRMIDEVRLCDFRKMSHTEALFLAAAAERMIELAKGPHPKPMYFNEKEGGPWYVWADAHLPSFKPYSIKFENGSIFELNRGWRHSTMPITPEKPPARLNPQQPIRSQIAHMLREIGLEPDRYLTKRPDDSPFNYGMETDPMCTPGTGKATTKQIADAAADELARLMKDDLGVTIPPILLRLWLVERWDRVAKLAHKIHGS